MRTIYLAGPIAGLTYHEANAWRLDVAANLENVRCFNPLHGVDPWEGRLQGSTLEQSVLTTPRGVVSQDYFYTTKSDMLLVHFKSAQGRPSLGTVIECAWAFSPRIPIVATLDDIHDHTMLREMIDFIVDDLDEAIQVVKKVLHA